MRSDAGKIADFSKENRETYLSLLLSLGIRILCTMIKHGVIGQMLHREIKPVMILPSALGQRTYILNDILVERFGTNLQHDFLVQHVLWKPVVENSLFRDNFQGREFSFFRVFVL